LEVTPGSVKILHRAVLARAARVGPGLSAARAGAIGFEILATCGEELDGMQISTIWYKLEVDFDRRGL
jgi:hypothetical protein